MPVVRLPQRRTLTISLSMECSSVGLAMSSVLQSSVMDTADGWGVRVIRVTRLWRDASTVSWKWYCLPDVIRSREPCADSVYPQSESTMWDSSVSPDIYVKFVRLSWCSLFIDPLKNLRFGPSPLSPPIISPYPSGARRSWHKTYLGSSGSGLW